VSNTDFLNTDPFAAARAAADYIAEETGVDRHDVALVLGSGWAEAADLIGDTTATLSADEVPGFHAPAVEAPSARSSPGKASGPWSLVPGRTSTKARASVPWSMV